jgi:hypothetical protein
MIGESLLGSPHPRMAPKYDFWKAISRRFIPGKANHESGEKTSAPALEAFENAQDIVLSQS